MGPENPLKPLVQGGSEPNSPTPEYASEGRTVDYGIQARIALKIKTFIEVVVLKILSK